MHILHEGKESKASGKSDQLTLYFLPLVNSRIRNHLNKELNYNSNREI